MSSGESWVSRENLNRQVPIARVIAALRSAQPGDLCVLGTDGFTVRNRPSLDYVLDLSPESDETSADESEHQAIAVLATWPTDLLVELVVQ